MASTGDNWGRTSHHDNPSADESIRTAFRSAPDDPASPWKSSRRPLRRPRACGLVLLRRAGAGPWDGLWRPPGPGQGQERQDKERRVCPPARRQSPGRVLDPLAPAATPRSVQARPAKPRGPVGPTGPAAVVAAASAGAAKAAGAAGLESAQHEDKIAHRAGPAAPAAEECCRPSRPATK